MRTEQGVSCAWFLRLAGAAAAVLLGLASPAFAQSAAPVADARCAQADRSAAAALDCPPLQAENFPILIAIPIELSARQFAASPLWLSARRDRPIVEPLGGPSNYEVRFAASASGAPLTFEFTGAPFRSSDAEPGQARDRFSRLVMRYSGNVESVQGWYLFAASNDEAIAWAMDRDSSNARRMQYQEGRVDMGDQIGFGRDLGGFQMAVFLGEYDIHTREGSTGNDMVGFTLSRRR